MASKIKDKLASHVNQDEGVSNSPFPPAGTYPDNRQPEHKHPNTEAFINAATKHVFPEKPAPSAIGRDAEGPEEKGALKEGEETKEEKEEIPIIGGTPLDEMGQTPGLEVPPNRFNFPKQGDDGDKPEGSKSSGPPQSHETIHEHPDEESAHQQTQHAPSSAASSQVPAKQKAPAAPLSAEEKNKEVGFLPGQQRPGFGAGKDLGSVRMGTSALVSALNALPWDDDGSSSDSSDEEDDLDAPQRGSASVMQERSARPKINRLGSSLHTIRPMNDRHKSNAPPQIQITEERNTGSRSSVGSDSIGSEAREMLNKQISREEDIGEDEEQAEILRAAEKTPNKTPLELEPIISEHNEQGIDTGDLNADAALREADDSEEEIVEERAQPNESERRRLRREKLAERLQDVFGLEEREEVLEEMKCWLLRSVMLKGYMYLTKLHICFFANMPHKENLVVKTGPLSKKASRTKLNTKFWVVLKNDVLSWYESTADPYFPKGNVSLQYASSCDPIEDCKFKLRTPERNYTFTADTEASRDEWIKAIKKVMFKTQHEGETVKLIIPLEAVLEIERAPTLEFAETIEIKCVDPDDQMAVDSYFFASFQDNDRAYNSIQRMLDQRSSTDLPRVLSATTLAQTPEPLDNSYNTIKRVPTTDSTRSTHSKSGLKKITSVLKPLIGKSSDKVDDAHDDTHKSSKLSLPFLHPKVHKQSHDSLETVRNEHTDAAGGEGLSDDYDDGYPPRQSGVPPQSMSDDGKKGWGSSWIRKPTIKMLASSPDESSASMPVQSPDTEIPHMSSVARSPKSRGHRGKSHSVTEVVEPAVDYDDDSEDELNKKTARMSFASDASSGSQMNKSRSDFSMMEASETGKREDVEMANKFRSVFALGEKEELVDHFPGFLYRVLPVSGRFFVSTNYLCFRSSQLLYKTKMMIPIKDLYGMKAQKAFRFGHSALIIVVKGHEEIFLEFSSEERRKACITILEQQMEEVRTAAGDTEYHYDHEIKNRIMDDLDESTPVDTTHNVPPVEPSHLFGSTTSTFLEFKPEPMRFTCLTIGSRGDVQPYIALCKGLQAEGHHTRIASHGEYREWVEGHGIEFASVGGDPAELMAMCVENGMFTISFMKEGLQKFRGWLDDLLTSSWKACQGSDCLIESPSAMGGVHIAEALQIPYFRAFTMPWTRTRAYPHAFAVPEHKRGGSFNYMTYTMFDQVFWRAISGQVNRWRRKTLNIEPTTFDRLEQHKIPFLYNFSPSVVPPPLDWTEWIHVTGYWFLENADQKAANKTEWTPPQELLDFIDNAHKGGKKVVYIGFGSIVVSDPEEMTRCVVEAVVDSGVCAILSKGWSDRGSKDKGEKEDDGGGADGIKYPPEIYSIDSIDHAWLFPRIDAACHHGGAGTSGASLRAGIPTIIKPFFGDQAFWSERVESLNVGSAVRKLTAQALSEALKKATTDEKQIAKAKIIGEMIRRENGVAKAIEAIYRDLEYAKSLIKQPGDNDTALDKVTSMLAPLKSHTSHSRSGSRSSAQQSGIMAPGLQSQSDDSERQESGDDTWSVVSGGASRSRTNSIGQSDFNSPEPRKEKNDILLGLGKAIPNPFKKKDKDSSAIADDE
ncbi:hypothetical protein IAU60_002807 [Kwoniella sp. DSM 27419]